MDLEEDGGCATRATVPREPKSAGPIPWEDPDLPRLRAFCRTLRELLFAPKAFFQRLGENGWGEALAFGLITGTAGLLAGLFWGTLLYAAAGRAAGEYWGIPQLYEMGTGFTVFLMVTSPALALFNLAFGACCLWAAAALCGAGRDFNPAWRIYSYAQGAMVVGLIPFLGVPLAGLWGLFLVYLGVQTVFKTSGGRTLGVLVLFLLLNTCGLLLLLGILLAVLVSLRFLLFLS